MDTKSMNMLVDYIQPFYSFVQESLNNLACPNYFLISTLSYVDSSPEIAIAKLKHWLLNHDLNHEITVIIFERLFQIKNPPKKARPLMAEYYFAMDFKFALSKKINKYSKPKIKLTLNKNFYFTKEKTESTGNEWYDYLISLYEMGYNNTDIATITNLSRKTIIQEGKKICQCLKLKPSKN